MPWPSITLRERRKQVRDDIAAHLPGADASLPNSPLRVIGDAQASLTHDNDKHLDWIAHNALPDRAEGGWLERWGSLFLPDGRKPATFALGSIIVTGAIGAAVETGALLTATVVDPATGGRMAVTVATTQSVTLATTSAAVAVEATIPGSVGNLADGLPLAFVDVPAGIDGQAVVASGGLAYGDDAEPEESYRARIIDVIQEPPHGGNAHDYEQWLEKLPGIEPGRAWCAPQEMGIGTVTLRFMLDTLRASGGGFPLPEDLALVKAAIDKVRPCTVAQIFVVAPIAQPLNLTIGDLVGDTPEVRANIRLELLAMLRARAKPGGMIFASWIREAVSAATGEDHHDLTVANVAPLSFGHIVTLGTITYA